MDDDDEPDHELIEMDDLIDESIGERADESVPDMLASGSNERMEFDHVKVIDPARVKADRDI